MPAALLTAIIAAHDLIFAALVYQLARQGVLIIRRPQPARPRTETPKP